MNNSLNGKIALVTGGTKGIGKAIADKLSDAGATVIITARMTPEEYLRGQYFIAANLSKAESAKIISKEIIEKYGKLDIILNNAGANLTPSDGYGSLTDDDWDNELQLNLMSAVRINKTLFKVFPLMGT